MASSTTEPTFDQYRAHMTDMIQSTLSHQVMIGNQPTSTAPDAKGMAAQMGLPVEIHRIAYSNRMLSINLGLITWGMSLPEQFPETGEVEIRVTRCEFVNGTLAVDYRAEPVVQHQIQMSFDLDEAKSDEMKLDTMRSHFEELTSSFEAINSVPIPRWYDPLDNSTINDGPAPWIPTPDELHTTFGKVNSDWKWGDEKAVQDTGVHIPRPKYGWYG